MGVVHRKLIIGRVKMLLKKHCNIEIDEHEIDTNISISENYYILREKYEGKIPIHSINDYE